MSPENGDAILTQRQVEMQERQCQTPAEEFEDSLGMYVDPEIPTKTFETIDAACGGIAAQFDSLPDTSWEGVLELLELWRAGKHGAADREGRVFLAALRYVEQLPAPEQQQAWNAVRSLSMDRLNHREVLH